MDPNTLVPLHTPETLAARPPAGAFRVRVDDALVALADPVVTGQQVLEAVRKFPTDEHLVFQVLPNGQLEEVRLDETVDLRHAGVEQFLTWRSDRSFRFVIDGRRFEWGAPVVTGRKLKDLAGVDPATYGVWLEVRGAEDRPVGDAERIDLAAPGVERFFTGKQMTTEGAP